MPNAALTLACPTCGAAVGQRCRTPAGAPMGSFHRGRWIAVNLAAAADGREQFAAGTPAPEFGVCDSCQRRAVRALRCQFCGTWQPGATPRPRPQPSDAPPGGDRQLGLEIG